MGINDEIYVAGYGAVSPAGWNARDLCEGVANGAPLPVQSIERPGWSQPLTIRRVPPSMSRATTLANPRLRRSSPIGQFSTVAAAEALVKADEMGTKLSGPLGIVFCTTCGCVTYSRRFWDEVLKDPTFASPLIFPETVFNAPASHISAVIGTSAANYTLIGDSGVYLQGLAVAAGWLLEERVEACLVIAAEEADWLTADVLMHFNGKSILSEGAGALLLRRGLAPVGVARLSRISSPHAYGDPPTRIRAIQRVMEDLGPDVNNCAVANDAAMNPWSIEKNELLRVRAVCGEGFAAATAWQCIVAIDAAIRKRYDGAVISVGGAYQEAMGARFEFSNRGIPS